MEDLNNTQAVTFHIVLKRLLEKHKMRQIDVADVINMPQSTFHDWITGRSPRDLSTVKKIADHFKVEFEYMIFGTKKDQEEAQSYIRKLEFENAMLKLEKENQLFLFETKEEALARMSKLKQEINCKYPDLLA